MSAARASAAVASPERTGVLAVVQDQTTRDRLNGIASDQQLGEELIVEGTLDGALRQIRAGRAPRVMILDISDAAAPVAEIGAARAAAGDEVKLVALGAVNDVSYFRDLLVAGAADYLVKPPTREALMAALERARSAPTAAAENRLGEVVAFIGSRGGVGTTTTAVACAWLLAEERKEPTALLDLDLHFGTAALKLDMDPGSGLCEALEQPSRIDSLFIERAMVRVTDNLRVLAAEASATQALMIDAGAIDMVIYELRRKFSWVIVDLPRGATPMQRVVLAAAGRAVVLCERSLAGLRDTIRLQTLVREQLPNTRLLLVEAGAPGERAMVGKAEFEKGLGKALDASLGHDSRAAGEAANAGQPLPVVAPRSPLVRDLRQLVTTLSGPAEAPRKRRLFALRSLW
jgi:pilus assembly protein CpaE